MAYDPPDTDLQTPHLVLLVTGAHLRAEIGDRPLAYRLQKRIDAWRKRYADQLDVEIRAVVCSDLWYLNNEALQQLPTISIGGPGVNALSALFAKQLPEDDEDDLTGEPAPELEDELDALDGEEPEPGGEPGGGGAEVDEPESGGPVMPEDDAQKVVIQIDPDFTDLRACIWGTNHELTEAGVRVFSKRYIDGFLRAVATQVEPRE